MQRGPQFSPETLFMFMACDSGLEPGSSAFIFCIAPLEIGKRDMKRETTEEAPPYGMMADTFVRTSPTRISASVTVGAAMQLPATNCMRTSAKGLTAGLLFRFGA